MEPFVDDDDEMPEEDSEMRRRETELTDFLLASRNAYAEWAEVIEKAYKKKDPKTVSELIGLRKKVISFVENRMKLKEEYDHHLDEWEKWFVPFEKQAKEFEKEDADLDIAEAFFEKAEAEMQELRAIFENICDDGLKLKEEFFDLNAEIYKLKE